VGRGIDSFYEYMLKGHMLLRDAEYLAIFHDMYHAALRHLKHGPWYLDVHLATAQVSWPLFNSLQCFWPGMQMLMGELDAGVETLRAFHTLWRHLGFHPEGFNLASMEVQAGQKGYPLRPEHAESLFWAHRTTGGDEWLRAGMDVLRSLERLRQPCGYAAVSDIINGTLEDAMESFFLSETLKYLYLLFDPDDETYVHGRYVFTTEAHPLPFDLQAVADSAALVAPAFRPARNSAADEPAIEVEAGGEHGELEGEEEEEDIAHALAQLQGMPHPEDSVLTEVVKTEAVLEKAIPADHPRLVGVCTLPTHEVRPRAIRTRRTLPPPPLTRPRML
jgi:hypothetical protein